MAGGKQQAGRQAGRQVERESSMHHHQSINQPERQGKGPVVNLREIELRYGMGNV